MHGEFGSRVSILELYASAGSCAMSTPSPKKPPAKLVCWIGEDTSLAGAFLDSGMTIGSAKSKNPADLLPYEVGTGPGRLENRYVKEALKSPRMLRLATNLYQLHGPLFSFKQTQLMKAFALVAKALKAVSRDRDVQAWSANETIKAQAFCTALRALFRMQQVPLSLKEELSLDDAGLASDAQKVKDTQGTDGKEDVANELVEHRVVAAAAAVAGRCCCSRGRTAPAAAAVAAAAVAAAASASAAPIEHRRSCSSSSRSSTLASPLGLCLLRTRTSTIARITLSIVHFGCPGFPNVRHAWRHGC